jgi:uncharacterized protein (DUF2141 family)
MCTLQEKNLKTKGARIIMAICIVCIVVLSAFSQDNNQKTIVLEISNVTPNKGTVYVSISRSETAYKKQTPDYTFQVKSSANLIRTEITVPLGDCVINVYQDLNGNGMCDSGLFGIPKEPVGITNWNGKGPPGNFNKHKINVSNTTKTISVTLYQL